MRTLLFDLETDGLLDAVTKIHCMVIMDVETGEVFQCVGEDDIVAGLRMLEVADIIAGHNIVRFDIPVLQKFYPWFKPKGKVRDTLVIAKLIWPHLKRLDKGDEKLREAGLIGSHSLKAWGIRLGSLKGDYAETTDWKEFTPEMLAYCVQDVEGPTLALWKLILKKDYSEEAIEVEHDFTRVAHLMELHGFRFDVAAAQKLHVQLVKRRLELEAQLQAKYPGWEEDMRTPEYWVASWAGHTATAPTKGAAEDQLWKTIKPIGGKRKEITFTAGPLAKKHTPFNPSSRHHITKVLMDVHGWKPVKFTDGGDPKLDEEVLESIDLPEAKLLIEYLTIDKRIGQLADGDNAWLRLVDEHGYIHGRIDSMGTVTSRCSHSNPNLGQVPAVDKPYGKECRALFIPDEGHVLVGADASGIQLRVIAHYASRYDNGRYVELVTKGDVHTANQQAIGLDTRAKAKTWIYCWLMGGGDAKLGSIAGYSAKRGREDKERFLNGFPALRTIKQALKEAVNEKGALRGLDGRMVPCDSAHASMGALLQAFEAVIVKKAIWLWYQDLTARGYVFGKDYALVAMVHDEIQCSCRPEIAAEVGKAFVDAIERAGIHFGSRCPLTGEWKQGASWAATH